MNRRNFLLTSGSTILALGGTVGELKQPALGLEFELSAIPNKRPKNINSILIKLTKFKIIPQYLDMSNGLDITIKVSINNGREVTRSVSDINFTNGHIIDNTDIQNQIGKNLEHIIIDGLSISQRNLKGEIKITINHSDIKKKRYRKSFEINNTNVIDSFEDNNISEYTLDVSSTSDTQISLIENPVYRGSYALDLAAKDVYSTGIQSQSGLPKYPQKGDIIRCFVQWDSGKYCDTSLFIGGGPSRDSIRIRADSRDEEGGNSILKLSAGSNSTSTSSLYMEDYENEWLEFWINWSDNNIITGKLRKLDGTVLHDLSVNDPGISGNYIKFFHNVSEIGREDGINDYVHSYFDSIEII
jgi:hypothetical protein